MSTVTVDPCRSTVAPSQAPNTTHSPARLLRNNPAQKRGPVNPSAPHGTLLTQLKSASPKERQALIVSGELLEMANRFSGTEAQMILLAADSVEDLYQRCMGVKKTRRRARRNARWNVWRSSRDAGRAALSSTMTPEALVTCYLELRSGDNERKARLAVLQHTKLKDNVIDDFSQEDRRKTYRLVARGTAERQTEDWVYEAAERRILRPKAAAAVCRLIECEHERLDTVLRHDLLFRTSLAKLDRTYTAKDEASFGLEVGDTPRRLNPFREVAIAWGDAARTPEALADALTPHRLALRRRLKHGAWARDYKVEAACQAFARYCAAPGTAPLFALYKTTPEAALAADYQAVHNKSLRTQLFYAVGSESRDKCQRLLGLSIDAAALVSALKEVPGCEEDTPLPLRQNALARALRRVQTDDGQTGSEVIWQGAQQLYKAISSKASVASCQDSLAEARKHFPRIATNSGPDLRSRVAELANLARDSVTLEAMTVAAIEKQYGAIAGLINKAGYTADDKKRLLAFLGIKAQAGNTKTAALQATFRAVATLDATSGRALAALARQLRSLDSKTQSAYAARYGLTPRQHLILTIQQYRSLHSDWSQRKRAAKRNDKTFTESAPLTLSQACRYAGISYDTVVAGLATTQSASLAIASPELVTPEFTVDTAKQRAKHIWDVLHGKGRVGLITATLYVGTPEELRLIGEAFAARSGGLSLFLYLEQSAHQHGNSKALTVGSAGKDGSRDRRGLRLRGQRSAKEAALAKVTKGALDLGDLLRVAIAGSDADYAYTLIEKATAHDKQAVRDNGDLMLALRQTFGGARWERIHLGLHSRGSLFQQLLSRAYGESTFDATHEDGMMADIKDFFDNSSLPDAYKRELAARLYGSADIQALFSAELSGVEKGLAQGALLNAGAAPAEACLLTQGNLTEDEAEVTKKIYAAAVARREALLLHPDFMVRLAAHCGNKKDYRNALSALVSTGKGADDDNYAKLDKASWSTAQVGNLAIANANQTMRHLLELSQDEVARVKATPSMVAQLQGALYEGQEALLDELLTGETALFGCDAKALLGDDAGRIQFLAHNAKLRLRRSKSRSWDTALRHLVEIYKMDFTPKGGTASGDDVRAALYDLLAPEVEALLDAQYNHHRYRRRAVIRRAMLGEHDPSTERLAEQKGTLTDDFKEAKETVEQASDDVIVREWSNILSASADGRASLAAVYADYHKARSKKGATYQDIKTASLAFRRYPLDVSTSFETLALSFAGGLFAERTSATARAGERRMRDIDNSQYVALRNIVRARLAKLSAKAIGAALSDYGKESGAYPALNAFDQALIDTPTRRALTANATMVDAYVGGRGVGTGAFDSDEGTRTDLAMEAYMQAMATSDVDPASGYGTISEAQEKDLTGLADNVTTSMAAFKEAREQVVGMWTTALGLAITAVITICTGGTATGPALMALQWALTMGAAETGSVLAKEFLMGSDFDLTQDGASEIMTATVMGAITSHTMFASNFLTRKLQKFATIETQVAGQLARTEMPLALLTGQEIFMETIESSYEIVLQAGGEFLNPQYWAYGFYEGLARAQTAARGQIAGLPQAVVMSAIMPLRDIRRRRVDNARRRNGDGAESEAADAALERTLQTQQGRNRFARNLHDFFGNPGDFVIEGAMETAMGKLFDGHVDMNTITTELIKATLDEMKEGGAMINYLGAIRQYRTDIATEQADAAGLSPTERQLYLNMVNTAEITDPIPNARGFTGAREAMITSALIVYETERGIELTDAQRADFTQWAMAAGSSAELHARLDPRNIAGHTLHLASAIIDIEQTTAEDEDIENRFLNLLKTQLSPEIYSDLMAYIGIDDAHNAEVENLVRSLWGENLTVQEGIRHQHSLNVVSAWLHERNPLLGSITSDQRPLHTFDATIDLSNSNLYAPGSFFPGIFFPNENRVLLLPGAQASYSNGENVSQTMPRNGAHWFMWDAQVLLGNVNNDDEVWGFTCRLEEDGSISVRGWNSISVNVELNQGWGLVMPYATTRQLTAALSNQSGRLVNTQRGDRVFTTSTTTQLADILLSEYAKRQTRELLDPIRPFEHLDAETLVTLETFSAILHQFPDLSAADVFARTFMRPVINYFKHLNNHSTEGAHPGLGVIRDEVQRTLLNNVRFQYRFEYSEEFSMKLAEGHLTFNVGRNLNKAEIEEGVLAFLDALVLSTNNNSS